MKRTINEHEFADAFTEMNRQDNFSYEGLKALYDYLTELEDDTGIEIELDVIAICCEYCEYEDIYKYLDNYNTDIDRNDYNMNEDIEREMFEEEVKKEIQEKTTFIDIDGTSFIIQAY